MNNERSQRLKILDMMLSKGEWITFKDVCDKMDEVFRKSQQKFYAEDMNRAYGNNFRKDISIIREILKDPELKLDPEMLQTEGSKRNMKYKYKEKGFSICQYMEYHYTEADYRMLDKALKLLGDLPENVYADMDFKIRSRVEYDFGKGEKKIDYSENMRLKGRGWLPLIYKSINKTPLRIRYSTYEGKTYEFVIHPYLLKLYNERWFMFGNREDMRGEYWNVPVDRIDSIIPEPAIDIRPRPDRYLDHFCRLIGVTDSPRSRKWPLKVNQPETVILGFHDPRAWGRTITKPLHPNQQIVKEFDGGYGEISICVVPNNEMFMRVLGLGENVSIVSPKYIKDEMESILRNLVKLYGNSGAE